MNSEKSTESEPAGQRLVYFVPGPDFNSPQDNQLTLRIVWNTLWWGKWIILAVTTVFAVGSVFYALAQTEWYRAEVLLAPAERRSTIPLGGQLESLAALAGVPTGSSNVPESLAVLRSREFAKSFIEERNLLTDFFEDQWDAEQEKWRGDDPESWPDMRDAVQYFHETVLKVSEDRRTMFVTLAVEWTDPQLAADWANDLARRLNERVRDRALREAQANVRYLQAELEQTHVVTLQQSIGRLLEAELQKLMLARGNEEFAFRVIDYAEPPKRRVRPHRALIAMSGTILGGLIGVLAVFSIQAWRKSDTGEH